MCHTGFACCSGQNENTLQKARWDTDTAEMQEKFSLAFFQISGLTWLNILELKVRYKMRNKRT